VDLVAYDDLNSFLNANGTFLNQSEAENNSFLGALAALATDMSLAEQGTYLAPSWATMDLRYSLLLLLVVETSLSAQPSRTFR